VPSFCGERRYSALNKEGDIDHALKERGVDIALDLNEILSVEDAGGLLEKYKRVLSKVILIVRAEEEGRRRKKEEEERVRAWLRAKLGVDDVRKAVEKLAELGVGEGLIFALARRGVGSEVEVKELAEELGVEEVEVEAQLESLYRAGIVGKKYVA